MCNENLNLIWLEHDNLGIPGVAGLNQEVRVATRWGNREKNQASSVNTLSNPTFDRDAKRGGLRHDHYDQDVQDSASVYVHPDTISGTHSVKNMMKQVKVHEISTWESKPNDGESSLKVSVMRKIYSL